jgi:hypothetical protein
MARTIGPVTATAASWKVMARARPVHHADRAELVGEEGGGCAVDQPHGGMGGGDDLFGDGGGRGGGRIRS